MKNSIKCKNNEKIFMKKWIIYNENTQEEYLNRKELKDRHCFNYCDKFKQRACDVISSLQK